MNYEPVIVFDTATGQTATRPLTTQEAAERDSDRAIAEQLNSARAAAEAVVLADLTPAKTTNLDGVITQLNSDLTALSTALTAVGTDLTAVGTAKTLLAAAGTLADVKPIVNAMLDREQARLNREQALYSGLQHILTWLKLALKPLGRLVDRLT